MSGGPTDHSGVMRVAARRTTPKGPFITPVAARRTVTQLTALSTIATRKVAEITGLEAEPGHPAVVVDRAGWIDSNIAALDVVATLVGEEGFGGNGVSDRLGAMQTGLALGWISGKILGQYEALSDPGRLLLVAPNISAVETALNVKKRDFRMWVCLHEETHRVQFGANPWMRPYFMSLIEEFINASKPSGRELTLKLITVLVSLIRRDQQSILDLVQSEEQKKVYDKISALMTLLEGHADVVMDLGGPDVIPTVDHIRSKFEQRRKDNNGFVSHLLGMNEKLMQYKNGAAFVKDCVDTMGMADFNVIWQGPQTLPTQEEIHAPERWRARMLSNV